MINKIAMPHQFGMNSQRVKLLVRAPTSVPVMISSQQASLVRQAPKYVVSSQVRRAPIKMSPIMALANVTKKHLYPQTQSLLTKPSPLVPAPKSALPVTQNYVTKPYQFHNDVNLDALIKNLLFHNLKKPYVPEEANYSTLNNTEYICEECKDRFLLHSSLVHHISRRSVCIKYWCRICQVEYQFFNRCVFLKHIRKHNCSITNIDTSCVTFNSVTREMIKCGIASSSFKECSSSSLVSCLPIEDSVLKRGVQDKSSSKEVDAPKSGSENPVPMNSSATKMTTLAGPSKGVAVQNHALLLNKTNNNSTSGNYNSQKFVPLLLPNSKLSVIQSVQKQSKEVPKPTKNVIFVCNTAPVTKNTNQNINENSISSNVPAVCEAGSQTSVMNDGFVDHDGDERINYKNDEEEEIDIINIPVDDDNLCTVQDSNTSTDSEKNKSKSQRKSKGGLPKPVKTRCSECGVSCLRINKHLNGVNRPTNPNLTCDVCKLILPTKCSLRMHYRIHSEVPPHKCPDCGIEFSSWDDFMYHIQFSCGHLAKCIRYMCVSCKAHFPSQSILCNHIHNNHTRDIHKCEGCPVAFYSKESLQKHLYTKHQNGGILGMDYKQCSMCPKKLVPMEKFPNHVLDHTKSNSALMYGYKCPFCKIVFANKMAFIIHQLKEKRELEEKENVKGKKKDSSRSKSGNNVTIRKELDCGMENENPASDSNSELEEEPEIVRKYPEPIDESLSAEKDPLSLEDYVDGPEQRVNEEREELCIVCKKNLVVLLPGIDLNEQSLCCKQCVRPLDGVHSSPSCAEKTFQRIRIGPKISERSNSSDDNKGVLLKRRASDISQDDGCLEINMLDDFVPDFIPTKKKSRANKKVNKDIADYTDPSCIQGQIITSKSPDEMVCSKCNFAADQRNVFLEHISVHRTDHNTFQCLECGQCFVVLPSLERHLQIHHGINDVNAYTESNPSCLPQPAPALQDSCTVDDNQCKVCFMVMDSLASLEKHFRTHGMAFMNSLSKSP